MTTPVQPTEPIALSVIRKWPEGFEARLQAMWVDVISFIPTVKLYDLQRVLAEFGFRMEVYEDAAHPPVQPTEPECEAAASYLLRQANHLEANDDLQVMNRHAERYREIAALIRRLAHPPVQPTEPVAMRKLGKRELVSAEDMQVYAQEQAVRHAHAPVQPTEPDAKSEQWIQKALWLVEEYVAACKVAQPSGRRKRAAWGDLEAHLRSKG